MKKIYLVFTLMLLIACNSDKKTEQTTLISEDLSILDTSIQKKGTESYERGKEVYSDFCVTCHLPSGKGIPGNFPPLANSDWLTDKKNESIKAIKYGLSGSIVVNGATYNNVMTPQGLSDQEVADVMNYISNSWGNTSQSEITIDEVSSISK